MTTASTPPVGEDRNTAATRIALSTARLLTIPDQDDSDRDEGRRGDARIPDLLPADPDELRAAISGLEFAAASYSHRAHDASGPDPVGRAYSTVLYTRAAYDLLRTILSYGRAVTGDRRPAHLVAEAVLLATLTWRLSAGEDKDSLLKAGVRSAQFVAGELTGEAEMAGRADEVKARRRLFVAADELGLQYILTSPGDVTDPGVDEPPLDFATNPQAWDARAYLANRSAMVQLDDPIGPYVDVAGLRCSVVLNGHTGRLTVLLDTATPQRWLSAGPDGEIPVEVRVNGEEVYRS